MFIVSSTHKGNLFKYQIKKQRSIFELKMYSLVGDSGSALYTTLNGRQTVLGICSYMFV